MSPPMSPLLPGLMRLGGSILMSPPFPLHNAGIPKLPVCLCGAQTAGDPTSTRQLSCLTLRHGRVFVLAGKFACSRTGNADTGTIHAFNSIAFGSPALQRRSPQPTMRRFQRKHWFWEPTKHRFQNFTVSQSAHPL